MLVLGEPRIALYASTSKLSGCRFFKILTPPGNRRSDPATDVAP